VQEEREITNDHREDRYSETWSTTSGTNECSNFFGVNNQVNCIHEEIKSRLNSGNDCCCLVQNLLSSSLLSKNTKINVYRTVILLFVLYECGTSSLRFREGCRSRVFNNRVLRKIFGPKRDDVTGK